jgi:sulfur relay protein TusB/DsrH
MIEYRFFMVRTLRLFVTHMATPLYCLACLPNQPLFWECCQQLQHATPHTALLLFSDALYAMALPEKKFNHFVKLTFNTVVYALTSDLETRGLVTHEQVQKNRLFKSIAEIDFDQWVDLTEHHHPIITWG